MTRSADFNLAALYSALDAQRQARGITWRQALLEINAAGRWHVHPLTQSTVSSLRTKAVAEGDGILQMLRSLNRTPESFVAGCDKAAASAMKLPDAPSHQILRFDTARLHASLEAQRNRRGLTWQQVAEEVGGMTAASVTHLRKGGRTAFPHVTRMARWLNRPVADFVRASDD